MRGGEQGAQEVCEEGFQPGTMPFGIDCRWKIGILRLEEWVVERKAPNGMERVEGLDGLYK